MSPRVFSIGLLMLVIASIADAGTPAAAAFVVYREGGETVAVSGRTGALLQRGEDASAVIQAAIDALPANGGRIYLGAGHYKLTRTLSIRDRHGVHIEGAARSMHNAAQGGTVLHADTAIDLLEIHGEKHRVFGVTVSNLSLQGSGKDNGKAGLVARGTTDLMTIHNVGANNNGIGFHLQGGGDVSGATMHKGVLDAVNIYACDPQINGIGIKVERAHYTKLQGLEVSDNEQYGILVESPDSDVQRVQGLKILNTTAVRNGKAGIVIGSNVEDLTIGGGSDIGGTREGPAIRIDGQRAGGFVPRNILIANTHLYNNRTFAVEVGHASHVLIQGNIITQHPHRVGKIKGQQHGLLVGEKADNVLISGNVLSGFESEAVKDLSGRAMQYGNLVDDEPQRHQERVRTSQ